MKRSKAILTIKIEYDIIPDYYPKEAKTDKDRLSIDRKNFTDKNVLSDMVSDSSYHTVSLKLKPKAKSKK